MDLTHRLAALQAAAFNTARLPASAVVCDLSTDVIAPPTQRARGEAAALDSAVATVLGGRAWLAAPLGRAAEAVVATALVRPGLRVLCTEVYVTGRWSIARCGGALVDLSGGTCAPGGLETIDLARAEAELRRGDVACIWLCAPRCLLGPRGGAGLAGATLAALASLRDRVDRRVPIVLDASRLAENVARDGDGGAPALRRQLAAADLVVLSGRKDAGGAALGLISAADPAWIDRLRPISDLLLGPGDGRARPGLGALARGLLGMLEPAAQRWRALDDLARGLVEEGVPLRGWGGGALFLDAAAMLPQVPAEQLPASTLLALLYLTTGARGLGTPPAEPGAPTLRLSLREHGPWLARTLPRLARLLADWRVGLRRAPDPTPTPFLEPIEPIDEGAWAGCPALAEAPRTAGPAVLGGADGAALHAALRARLGLSDAYALFPAIGPRQRLIAAWAGLAPTGTVRSHDPVITALAELWRGRHPADAPHVLGDMFFETCREGQAHHAVRELGPPAAWGPAPVDPMEPGVDVALCADLCATPAAVAGPGFTLVRRAHPLCAALAESTLFTAGPVETGGLDADDLAAALAAVTRRPP
ncbi:MAG: hypothetical protein IPO88_27210 [Nannocystis sp.]|uniref:beta-eliminating lyase-related protein n=1 Tax=Nannocystis sp. TaxID=1962667 RepID=UPI0024228D55|nr:beta-eliminating lyase-related protein [Nannocystis sp.]MBK9757120.1 hypothetical protein [Nannocystis sp.]